MEGKTWRNYIRTRNDRYSTLPGFFYKALPCRVSLFNQVLIIDTEPLSSWLDIFVITFIGFYVADIHVIDIGLVRESSALDDTNIVFVNSQCRNKVNMALCKGVN